MLVLFGVLTLNGMGRGVGASRAMLTANPNASDLHQSAKSPGQDDQGLIMEGAGGEGPVTSINDQQALVPARTARL